MDCVNVNKYVRTGPVCQTFAHVAWIPAIDNRRINQQYYHRSNRLRRGAARIPGTAY